MKTHLLALAAALAAVSAFAPAALAQSNPPLAATATAENPAPEFAVSTDTDAIRFDVHAAAPVASLRVTISRENGDVVFDTGTVAGSSFQWDMKTRAGERVPDGAYVASIAARDATGETTEQDGIIAVSSAEQADAGATPNTSGTGTPGKIAKWTAAGGVLGNSAMTELTRRIGINAPNPAAILHIAGPQLASTAGAGVNAVPLLSMTGGKGGATTGTTKPAGNGAPVQLIAGNGGNAPTGGRTGNGGNVLLQPGVAGTGGSSGGANGKVLLAPSSGNVGVGTFLPGSKLTVAGPIETQNSPNASDGGIKYPDGTVQNSAKAPDAEKLDGVDSSGYVRRVASGTGSISFPSISASHCLELSVSLSSSILPGDIVFFRVQPNATLPAGLTFHEINVPSAGHLTFRVCNGNTNTSFPANDLGVVYYAIRP